MKYTKGSWALLEIHGWDDEQGHEVHAMLDVGDPDSFLPVAICEIPIESFNGLNSNGPEYNVSREESIANGRLIAAAPEMFEALNKIISSHGSSVSIVSASKLIRKINHDM